jgi:hypothetical protein
VLDGRLIGERSEEINLAELLKVAQREFDAESDTLDEARVYAQVPSTLSRTIQLAESERTSMSRDPSRCRSDSKPKYRAR